ncbi:MAG: tyrosine-type recombinase/integrase, partial [Terracidiphilus sp.]
GRGWHATTGTAPRTGEGSATVEPIREPKDIKAIKGALADAPRDFALFVFGIHVGLRGGDLLAIRWSDVISPDGRFRKRIEITETKTKKRRIIALQDNARNALEKWRSRTPPEADQFVFPGPDGNRLTIQRLHQLVNQWARLAGVNGHFGSHTLRKTYGYHLHRAGVGIETLMKVFGHSSPSITLRYIGIEQKEIDEANLKLNL